jgi:hypothetical protein
MSDIKVITPPDRLYTDELSFLLVYPSKKIKEEFTQLVSNFDQSIHVYLYEQNEQAHEPEWLLDVFLSVNYVIIDIDNSDPQVRSLASYFISKDKTYWLTNSTDTLYNVLSKNRIFSLDFLYQKLGG